MRGVEEEGEVRWRESGEERRGGEKRSKGDWEGEEERMRGRGGGEERKRGEEMKRGREF